MERAKIRLKSLQSDVDRYNHLCENINDAVSKSEYLKQIIRIKREIIEVRKAIDSLDKQLHPVINFKTGIELRDNS